MAVTDMAERDRQTGSNAELRGAVTGGSGRSATTVPGQKTEMRLRCAAQLLGEVQCGAPATRRRHG